MAEPGTDMNNELSRPKRRRGRKLKETSVESASEPISESISEPENKRMKSNNEPGTDINNEINRPKRRGERKLKETSVESASEPISESFSEPANKRMKSNSDSDKHEENTDESLNKSSEELLVEETLKEREKNDIKTTLTIGSKCDNDRPSSSITDIEMEPTGMSNEDNSGRAGDEDAPQINTSDPVDGKRKLSLISSESPRKKKKNKISGLLVPKNALMQLNEIRPGLQYKFISQTGPVHLPNFVISVEVNGQVFEGSGSTKKKAKLNAAEQALRSFVQFPNASEAHYAMGRHFISTGFTSDQANVDGALFSSFGPQAKKSDLEDGPSCGSPKSNINGSADLSCRKTFPLSYSSPGGNKNPVMLLNELRPNTKYKLIGETGDTHAKTFIMAVTVEDEEFQGSGRNKKTAKSRAAQAALVKIFKVVFPPAQSLNPVTSESGQGDQEANLLADTVTRLILDKFSALTDGFSCPHSRRKVLAGIVMTTSTDTKDASVICIGTGTKCINGEYMSDRGLSVNDCHAEIIARRSLLTFLYSQLGLHLDPNTAEQSIFVAKENDSGYRLKENVKFHLYISTSPCGDARIFSPHEIDMACDNADRHPNRKARGLLRTKIESGEGTIPVKSNLAIQTWDGVLQGERLLTMSCSDKILRWNVLGLQGALLSHFVDPIFLDSIILGSLYHADHMCRAVQGRINDVISNLPESYRVNKPLMSAISSPESRQPGKAPNFSVNWAVGEKGLEVINAMTGKAEQNCESRISKHSFFIRFSNLYGRISSIIEQTLSLKPKTYGEAKAAVTDYQLAKQQLFLAFQKGDLGTWVKKPVEQDQFEI